MMPAVTAPACQVFGISEKITLATRMIAEISIMLRRKRAVFRYCGGSSTILRTRRAPGLPSSSSRLARALENEDRAASAAAVKPGEDHQYKGDAELEPVGLGHHGPLGRSGRCTAHAEMILSVRPNISACSSGSAWSYPSRCSKPVHQQILRLVAGGASMLARLPVGHRQGTARCRRADPPEAPRRRSVGAAHPSESSARRWALARRDTSRGRRSSCLRPPAGSRVRPVDGS